MGTLRGYFIRLTLSQILPHAFAAGDRRIIGVIVEDSLQSAHDLFLTYRSKILAHIFLLPGHHDTNKGLNFVTAILSEATNHGNIDVQSVVKSCVVALLAELVIAMGEQNARKSDMVCNYCLIAMINLNSQPHRRSLL